MTKDEIILAQQARIEQLLSVVEDLSGLIDESSGVYGLHLNGDPSPWEELLPGGRFERITNFYEALATQDNLSALRAHDAKLLAPYQWQPIETAPKDGTAILISNGKGAWVAKYKDVYQSGFKPNNPWLSLMLNKDHIPKRLQFGGPTHWMPLPSTEAIEKGGV